ncbi:hypothetical protein C2845_PM03G21540 [Panicum miliaceum]|uniref:Uncharacterized protein n=1 Tax=Panicum miliaceum TaxID=4540 RepID=A0A3L6TCY0_PANMI|nr:hypothetical protein C2845_PM03G21540 [Panicum miliaceum]
MVVHPRSDLRLCSLPELQCLFAKAKKIKFSPVIMLITGRGPIDITSLVTRIATHVEALDNAQVTYLPLEDEYQYQVGVEHFVQGHMMREGPGNSLFMTYPRYDSEIELPCPSLSLYSVKRLLLQMQKKEPARHSVVGPVTRGRTRRNAQQQDQAGPSGTSHMNFEETYDYYTQGGSSTAEDTAEHEEPYYPAGMQDSYGPQAGPSSSARFGYEDPVMRRIMGLTTQANNLGLQQEQIGKNVAHNTDLTQQNWSMTTSIHQDTSRIFTRLGLDQQPPQQQQHYPLAER